MAKTFGAKTFEPSSRLANANVQAPEGLPSFLPHQERVNIEMFKAIETLGRKLEKSEEERDRLARRLALIESSTEVDAATGRLYLPALVGAPEVDAAVSANMPKWPAALSVFSGAVALFALAVVALRGPVPSLTPQQISALNALQLSAAAPRFEAPAARPWKRPEEVAALPPPPAQDVAPPAALPVAEAPVIAPPEITPPEIVSTPVAKTESTTPVIAPVIAPVGPVATEKPVESVAVPVPAVVKPVEKAEKEQKAVKAPAEQAKSEPVKSAEIEPDRNLPRQLADLEKRAFQGVAEAQHDLATLYASGKTIPQDYKRAVYWFSKAADGNVPNAHYNLGVMFQQGLGVRKDLAKALGWYQRAAALGHPEALYNLGISYIEGVGAPRDIKKGVAYFKSAANAGVAQAAFNLGVLYESNFLGPIDLDKALEWYSVAQDQGHADAAKAVKRLKAQMGDTENGKQTLAASDMAEPGEEEGEGDSSPSEKPSPAATSAKSTMILKIQKALADKKLLPRDAVTGVKDARTEDAIRAWQRKEGMTSTGEPSQALLDRLRQGG